MRAGTPCSAEGGDEVAADRRPAPACRAGQLAPTAGDPLLERKGRREDAMRPSAQPEARGDFGQRVAPQQAIQLLVGDVGSAQRRRQRLHGDHCLNSRAFPRAGVERRAWRQRTRDRPAPMDGDRTGEAHELRGRVQGAGQVVGHQAQGRHLATAPRRRGRNVLAEADAERTHLLVPPFIRGAVPRRCVLTR